MTRVGASTPLCRPRMEIVAIGVDLHNAIKTSPIYPCDEVTLPIGAGLARPTSLMCEPMFALRKRSLH
jgi:hypothetical protein